MNTRRAIRVHSWGVAFSLIAAAASQATGVGTMGTIMPVSWVFVFFAIVFAMALTGRIMERDKEKPRPHVPADRE